MGSRLAQATGTRGSVAWRVGPAQAARLLLSPQPRAMQQALGSRVTLPAPLRSAGARGAARGAPLLVQASKKVTKKAQVVLTKSVPNLGAEGLLTSVRLGYFRCGSGRAALCSPGAAPARGASRPRVRCAASIRPYAMPRPQALAPLELCSRRNAHARRNYLLPEGLAKLADESILASIKAKREVEEAATRKARAPSLCAACRPADGARPQVLDEAKALATALATIGKFIVKVKVGEDKRIFGRRVAPSLPLAPLDLGFGRGCVRLQASRTSWLASLLTDGTRAADAHASAA